MNFKTISTPIPDCFFVERPVFKDSRGDFFKMFEANAFSEVAPNLVLREIYFSTSKKNVLRGLHFQIPPQDHVKIVSCLQGQILDVVLDLREGSPTFQKAFSFELAGELGRSIVIPRGCAHGFYTQAENSLVAYLVETSHSPEHDKGILWNSIDFVWPSADPVVSDRDAKFTALKDFKTPFHF